MARSIGITSVRTGHSCRFHARRYALAYFDKRFVDYHRQVDYTRNKLEFATKNPIVYNLFLILFDALIMIGEKG